jgi:XTP/dITP diphosphohydrolase
VVALVHDGGEILVEGRMNGHVIREVRGAGGFGYDVLFVADDRPGLTTAELDKESKDAISHRGKALREIAPKVAEVLGTDVEPVEM